MMKKVEHSLNKKWEIFVFVKLGFNGVILRVSFRLRKYHMVINSFVSVLCVRTICYSFECEYFLCEDIYISYKSSSVLWEEEPFVECPSGGRNGHVKYVCSREGWCDLRSLTKSGIIGSYGESQRSESLAEDRGICNQMDSVDRIPSFWLIDLSRASAPQLQIRVPGR